MFYYINGICFSILFYTTLPESCVANDSLDPLTSAAF